MKKLTSLFLISLLACLPFTSAWATARGDNKDDQNYLAGAVPEVNGKVIFSKEYQIPGKNQDEIYQIVLKWMEERLGKNENQDSRVVYADKEEGTIAGMGEEWLVFTSKLLVLDRSLINYQLTAICKPEHCLLKIEKIRYTYEETEKYVAEEWITDKYALNKDKTKLARGSGKFRRKTVDFANEMFYNAAIAFGMKDPNKEAKEEQEAALSAVSTSGTIVIGKEDSKPAQETPQGYTSINLTQIPDEVYETIKDCQWVITIGKDQFNCTSMTANGGGNIEKQGDKMVVYCTLSSEQPHETMDKANTYTINLYAPQQNTPGIIIECKKLENSQDNQSYTYLGEIKRLLIKQ